jgi:hypothetical protein
MKKFKLILYGLPAMLLAFSMVAIPVYAHDGESSSDDNPQTAQNSSDDSNQAETNDTQKTETETENETELEDSLRQEGQDLLEKLRKEHKAQSQEDRQQKCQIRKHGLETKLKNLVKNTERHKTLIDKVYANALEYQKSKNLNPAGFSDLVTKADTAKTQAETSTAVLKALTPTIDCNKTTVASDVATFKTAAEQARNDLKAYRSAVRDVIKSLLTVAKENE